MASLSDLKRAWLIRQLGLTNPPLSEADLELQLYAQVNGVAGNKSFISGRWYSPEIWSTANGTIAPTLNLMYLMPFIVGKTTIFDRIGTEVTIVGAGSAIRLGVYNTVNGAPSGVELDAGTVDSSAAIGAKEIVINKSLSPGQYWLAHVVQGGAAPTVISYSSMASPYVGHTVSPGANHFGVYSVTPVAGAFPANPGPLTAVGGSTAIRVVMRAA